MPNCQIIQILVTYKIKITLSLSFFDVNWYFTSYYLMNKKYSEIYKVTKKYKNSIISQHFFHLCQFFNVLPCWLNADITSQIFLKASNKIQNKIWIFKWVINYYNVNLPNKNMRPFLYDYTLDDLTNSSWWLFVNAIV